MINQQNQRRNEYGDLLDLNDGQLKKFAEIFERGWKIDSDPYEDKEMDQIMNDYVKEIHTNNNKQN